MDSKQMDTVLTFPEAPTARQLLAQRWRAVYYPSSDGQPMAEDDPQYRCITDTRFALEQFYRENQDVYVGADLLVYYEKGDASKSVAPDVLVSLGVPAGNRSTYLIWEEGKPPDVVFEFASAGTWRADVGWKLELYAGMGVHEYFLFDPHGEYFDPMLQGHRRNGRQFEPIAVLSAAQGIRGLLSEVLGLELWVKRNGGRAMPYALRLFDPTAGLWLPTPTEEAQARREAEARVAKLEAELESARSQLSSR